MLRADPLQTHAPQKAESRTGNAGALSPCLGLQRPAIRRACVKDFIRRDPRRVQGERILGVEGAGGGIVMWGGNSDVATRPLLSDTGGGGGQNGPPGFWLTHPPTHIRKFFLRKKMKFYQRGPNLEVDFRYTNFFLASDPPTHPPV